MCMMLWQQNISHNNYDNRGNQTSIEENGIITKTFTFDTANMLAKVTDEVKGEATYSYNGFGKRVAVNRPEEKIEYLLDLTKDYHNMLERSVNGEAESYVYDNNVVSMSKAGDDYFYMLDELGTGMYLTGTDGTVSDTYAYDEFGRSLDPCTGKEKTQYQKQGNILQPLAFTGYQTDEMTESYFAQARFYNAGNGRFVSEDKVRGHKIRPDSINHYLYCYNMPIKLVDLNGREPIDDEFVDYKEHVEETSNAIETVDNSIDSFMDKLDEKDHPIIIIGGSGSAGSGGVGSYGAQLVIDTTKLFTDPLYCFGVQLAGGLGVQMGSSAKGSLYAGMMWADDITCAQGNGTEVGVSGGEVIVYGAGMWASGDADPTGEKNKFGGYLSLGVGVEGQVAELHVTETYGTPLFYPFQALYDGAKYVIENSYKEVNNELSLPKAKLKGLQNVAATILKAKEKSRLITNNINGECED